MSGNITKRPISEGAEEILDLYFPVLDHGFVALKDYYGTDKCIEGMARTSYSGGGTRKTSETRGLIRYLMRHAHTSPFEGVELKFHLSMPIFCARQHVRHRTAGMNEISGRYSLLPMLFYTPDKENFKKQSSNNKQGRDEYIEENKWKAAVQKWNELRNENVKFYTDLASEDIARELARIDLPLSTYTQLYWKIDLHNLFHFLKLRTDPHAQYEIRQYANVMAAIVKKVCPIAYEAWVDYELSAVKFSKQEHGALLKLINNQISESYLKDEFGLSKREISEFRNKLSMNDNIDFCLDMQSAKPGSLFEEKLLKAVPKIDK